jgi:hypothetical protein
MKINDIKNLFPHFNVDNFEHVLGHVSKAAGKLHGLVGDADHIEEAAEAPHRGEAFKAAEEANGKTARVYIADLIICAARLAALCPSGEFDLEQAVLDRVAEKRDHLEQYRRSPGRCEPPIQSSVTSGNSESGSLRDGAIDFTEWLEKQNYISGNKKLERDDPLLERLRQHGTCPADEPVADKYERAVRTCFELHKLGVDAAFCTFPLIGCELGRACYRVDLPSQAEKTPKELARWMIEEEKKGRYSSKAQGDRP